LCAREKVMSKQATTYVALIRGINVGRNTLKMDRLREICSKLGARDVRTYLQSGNVVFSAAGSSEKWSQALENKLVGETRLPVAVILRTADEIPAIAAGNPFLSENGIDTARLAVTFLQQPVSKQALAALSAMDLGSERYHHSGSGKHIYLHCPDGFAKAKLYLLDKVLGQKTTVRNWNTIMKLHEMSRD
jgi:uncharacterized protein (DUF1697 family)